MLSIFATQVILQGKIASSELYFWILTNTLPGFVQTQPNPSWIFPLVQTYPQWNHLHIVEPNFRCADFPLSYVLYVFAMFTLTTNPDHSSDVFPENDGVSQPICIVVLVVTCIFGLQSITSDLENKGSGGHVVRKQNHKQKELMRLFC